MLLTQVHCIFSQGEPFKVHCIKQICFLQKPVIPSMSEVAEYGVALQCFK